MEERSDSAWGCHFFSAMSDSVRVRFAPSPTGSVHIGNIRAAVFNWLFARHACGKFLLRIEDTDLVRSTKEAIDKVLDAMQWLGLNWDEEVVYQTHNAADHLAAVETLLSSGAAYKAVKESANPATGERMKGEVVLFRMPKEGTIEFTDLVKGRMRKKAADTQDFVIVRSDGSPVFHIANVVDDVKQGVTHVIRGDDHVENTFKHIQIFKALGAPVPQYGHLPMIVNAQGKPYSKRDGAAFVGEFKEQGFLPEALFNFLVLLGWAPGDDREVMSRDELVEAFTLDRCKASPARFDMKKLLWMNGEYIARQDPAVFRSELLSRLGAAGLPPDPLGCSLDELLPHIQIRTKTLSDLPGNCAYFFTDEVQFDPGAVAKRLARPGAKETLLSFAEAFENLPEFTAEAAEALVRAEAEKIGGDGKPVGMGAIVHPLRVAVSGRMEGPGLFEMLALLGRDRVVRRLRAATQFAT